MSDWQKDADETWPDAPKRSARRQQLFDRLDKFFDDFVAPQDSGWPIVSDKDMSSVWEIFREITDLKFGRDVDGDQVIDFYVCDRKKNRLVATTVPHRPREDSPLAEAEYLDGMARAAAFLDGSAADIMRSLSFTLSDKASAIRDNIAADKWLAERREEIGRVEPELAMHMVREMRKAPRRILADGDERLDTLLNEIATDSFYYDRYVKPDHQKLIAAIDAFDAAPLDDTKAEAPLWDMFEKLKTEYGNIAFKVERNRWYSIRGRRRREGATMKSMSSLARKQ